MTPQARRQLAQAWLRHCQSSHPGKRFRLVAPDERLKRNPQTATREVIGSVASPDEKGTISDFGASRADHDRVEGGDQ